MTGRQRANFVSASQLAQMGVCEQKIVYEAKYGRRDSPEQIAAQERGNSAHDRFFQDGLVVNRQLATDLNKPWCFIASTVFGEQAAETVTLRRFRDQVLRRHRAGRAFIRAYYRHAPRISFFLTAHPSMLRATRGGLTILVVLLRVLGPRENGRFGETGHRQT